MVKQLLKIDVLHG